MSFCIKFFLILCLCCFFLSCDSLKWYDCALYTTPQSSLPSIEESSEPDLNILLSRIKSLSKTPGYNIPYIPNRHKKNLYSKHQHHERADTAAGLPKAQCAFVPMQLNQNSSQVIHIWVKKLSPSNKVASKQIWLLSGGPGGASDLLEFQMHYMFVNDPDLEVFILDHRGVGRSTRLECFGPDAESSGSPGGWGITEEETASCSEFLQDFWTQQGVASFSTLEAARDVVNLIRMTQESNQKTFIYGISYGTYWASRILQLLEDSPLPIEGVVLDGVVSPTGGLNRTTLDQWDVRMNKVGVYFLQMCRKDPFCSSKLSATPLLFTRDLYQKLYSNSTHCTDFTQLWSREYLIVGMGTLLLSSVTREVIPGILYRLNRCSREDVDILDSMFTKFFDLLFVPEESKPLSSSLLYMNVAFSELWGANGQDTSFNRLYQVFSQTFFATGVFTLAPLVSEWDTYEAPAPYWNRSFVSKTNVLLLNGDLDAQTPYEYAETQFNAITGGRKELVLVPYAPHYTIFNSPVTNSEIDCGMQIMLSFIKSAGEPVNKDCTSRVVAPNFKSPTPGLVQLLFGVSDIYDGHPPPPPPPPKAKGDSALYILFFAVVLVLSFGLMMVSSYAFVLRRRLHYQDVIDTQAKLFA
eukprot:TRINITY_DN193_c6_g1_i1.p1 TRINITY_DN193_c6_g1~~TRINITY_DN193_c6_g1_i1.p1  ORF type:complete len:637 (-),score=107.23 TRINITY_DN193_c6_g1_i1:56-1966(-)